MRYHPYQTARNMQNKMRNKMNIKTIMCHWCCRYDNEAAMLRVHFDRPLLDIYFCGLVCALRSLCRRENDFRRRTFADSSALCDDSRVTCDWCRECNEADDTTLRIHCDRPPLGVYFCGLVCAVRWLRSVIFTGNKDTRAYLLFAYALECDNLII